MTFEISIIAWAAIMLTFGFVWSRNERRKKEKAKFVQGLKGHKFTCLLELQEHWKARGIHFRPVGEFEPERFGNLQETLTRIHADMEAHFERQERLANKLTQVTRSRGSMSTKVI